jgi:hypothetical protein
MIQGVKTEYIKIYKVYMIENYIKVDVEINTIVEELPITQHRNKLIRI